VQLWLHEERGKEMKLLKFSVTNFRGIQSLVIELNGKNVNFYGANGTGKTTTEDAFLWLLFGKDSSDRRDYDLIPHIPGKATPDVGNGKEPTVTATLEHNGKTITFKKSYLENFPTKGEFKGQYTGSTVHYFVDDLEVKAGEYTQAVSELVDESVFKLITNPVYFLQVMTWQERRAALKGLVSGVDAKLDDELKLLMGDRPFDKFHLLSKQNVKSTQKELDGMVASIKEASRGIPDLLPNLADMEQLNKEKADLETQLLNLKANDSTAARRRKLSELETNRMNAEAKYGIAQNVENDKIRAVVNQLEKELLTAKATLNQKVSSIGRLKSEIEVVKASKAAKLARYYELSKAQWEGSDHCAACGQSLPAEQVETVKAAFNTKRASDLEAVIAEGKTLKASLDGKEELLVLTQAEFDKVEPEVASLEKKIAGEKAAITTPNFKMTDEYKKLTAEIAELEGQDQMTLTQEGLKAEVALELKLEEVKKKISEDVWARSVVKRAEEQLARVEELKAKESELNATLSQHEKSVSLCEQHVKKQAAVLEEAVNYRFKTAKFKLFTMQKNGEEAETCEVVYPNGSTNLSTGERITTGIDIINTFSEFYGVNAPIFIDNAESISLPYETNSQVVRLVVSPSDKNLRWEIAE